MDADTKAVPAYYVGKRDVLAANTFIADLAGRMKNRIQISSDALKAHVDAIDLSFCDHKTYEAEPDVQKSPTSERSSFFVTGLCFFPT